MFTEDRKREYRSKAELPKNPMAMYFNINYSQQTQTIFIIIYFNKKSQIKKLFLVSNVGFFILIAVNVVL